MSNFVSLTQSAFRLKPEQSAFITQLVASGRGRETVFAIALALALSRICNLPGGEVESPEAYFDNQVSTDAVDALQLINEIVPVDYRTALALTRALYLTRYELANRPFNAFGVDRSNGVAAIFGLNEHIAPDILTLMQVNAQSITENAERFHQVIKALRKD